MKKILSLLFIIIYSSLFGNEDLKKVSIQFMWHDQFEFAGFYIAKEKGYYKEFNLDVEFKKFTVNTNITEKVINQEATFGTGSSSLIIDKSKGKDIVLLGSIFQSSPLILLGLKRPDLVSVKDIKNKSIMLTEDQQRFATLQSMLISRSVQLEDVNIIKHTFDVEDLINKKTDLMLAYTTNEPYILKEKGYEAQIFHPKDYGFDFYEELIFTSKDFADKNPQTVDNFYKATIKGWEYAFNNIEEVSNLIYQKYNPQNKSLESLVYEANEMKKLVYTKNGKIGTITEEKLKLIEYSYRILGLIDKKINFDELIFSNKNKKKSLLNSYERQYLDINRFISMCIDPNWMPIEKIKNGIHIGISADYIKILEDKLKTSIKLIPTKTWSESLNFSKNRKCDIFSLILETPERKKFLNFTKPIFEIPLVVATGLEVPFIENIAQLKNKDIGIVKGYAYFKFLKSKYPDINFIEVENIAEGLSKVKKENLYGFIDSLITIGHHIQNDYIGQLKITGKFKESLKLSMATRNDRPILNSIFNKAIETISEEEKQNILNKWVTINYEKKVNYSYIYMIFIFLFIGILVLGIIYRQYILNQANIQLNKKVKEEIDKNNRQHKVLTQQTKKVAMGEMLENIAHQWRQPLSVISVAATGIKMKKEFNILSDEELLNDIEAINNNAQFLSKTIDDFRDFYSDTKHTNEFFVDETIGKTLKLFGIQFNNFNITLVENIQSVKINTLENELIQVLINLLNNSKDALENSKDKKLILISCYEKDNYLNLEIIDSAGGIPIEILDKIFDPYFTTKHKSQGTGIGLYMSEQIITKHMSGTLEVDNKIFSFDDKKYKGAQFIIKLPLLTSKS